MAMKRLGVSLFWALQLSLGNKNRLIAKYYLFMLAKENGHNYLNNDICWFWDHNEFILKHVAHGPQRFADWFNFNNKFSTMSVGIHVFRVPKLLSFVLVTFSPMK